MALAPIYPIPPLLQVSDTHTLISHTHMHAHTLILSLSLPHFSSALQTLFSAFAQDTCSVEERNFNLEEVFSVVQLFATDKSFWHHLASSANCLCPIKPFLYASRLKKNYFKSPSIVTQSYLSGCITTFPPHFINFL